MLKLPNFGHMTTSTMLFVSHDKTWLVMSWAEILTSQSLFQNAFILRRSRVTNIADIIKISTIFIKKTVKRITNYVLKCKLYLYFLL